MQLKILIQFEVKKFFVLKLIKIPKTKRENLHTYNGFVMNGLSVLNYIYTDDNDKYYKLQTTLTGV